MKEHAKNIHTLFDGLQEESAENILTDDRRWKKLYTMVQKSGHNGI